MHLITIALGKEAEEGMSDVSSGGMVRQVLKLELLLTLVEGSGWFAHHPYPQSDKFETVTVGGVKVE
jgi:hypothetical protein